MRSWLSLLRTARGAVAVLLFGFAALWVPPQTRDMVAALEQGGSILVFHLALIWLSLNAWYWSRAALAARFGVADTSYAGTFLDRHFAGPLPPREPVPFAFRNLPRLLFVAGAVLGATLLLQNWSTANTLALAGWTVAFYYVLARRRDWQPAGLAAPQPLPAQPAVPWRQWPGTLRQRFRALIRAAPFPNPITCCLFLIPGTVAFFAGPVWNLLAARWQFSDIAVTAAGYLPGPALVVLLLALSIGPVTVVTFLFDGLKVKGTIMGADVGLNRPPIITILACYALAWMPFQYPSIHNLRTAQNAPLRREQLRTIFEDWVRTCYPALPPGQPVRPVIVAMSGGASRAAVWGLRAAYEVEAAGGINRPAVFAVSSVSGGSLGAAAYVNTLAARHVPACQQPAGPHRASTLLAIDEAPVWLGGDALGPLLGGWLLDDLPRDVLAPLYGAGAAVTGVLAHGGDSAAAIEHGFERLWQQRGFGPGMPGFDRTFLSLQYRDMTGTPVRLRHGQPIWIANGTDALTGNRLLTVPFRIDTGWPFLAAGDLLHILQADVPVSTAINNTARFPFLEPSGRVVVDRNEGTLAQLIDGGYFENEGLQTALELAAWLHSLSPVDQHPVEPVIVQATSDGEIATTSSQIARCGWTEPPRAIQGNTFLETFQVLMPVMGLYNVRGGHTALALRQAVQQYCSGPNGQRFFHFYLPGVDGTDVPLNWVLSPGMVRGIWHQMDNAEIGNRAEAAAMQAAFAADGQAAAAPPPSPAAGK